MGVCVTVRTCMAADLGMTCSI